MPRYFGGQKMVNISSNNLLPLYFAAPVNWYAELIQLDITKIANEQRFERQTFRNRFHYGSFQGTKLFTIPLDNSSIQYNYQKVKINYNEHWQNRLIHALQTSYGKSPFYEFYGYRFENIIRFNYETLWELNLAILYESLKCLKISSTLDFTSIVKIKSIQKSEYIKYYQVFESKTDFQPNLTILDLLYNEGPDAYDILLKTNKMIL